MKNRTEIQRHRTLVAAVKAAIAAADPIRLLAVGAPDDEYDAEVSTIVPRVTRARNLAEAHRIVHEEFVRWFGLDIAGSFAAYEVPAQAIWVAVLEFRQAG